MFFSIVDLSVLMLSLGFLVKIVDKWNQRRTGEKKPIPHSTSFSFLVFNIKVLMNSPEIRVRDWQRLDRKLCVSVCLNLIFGRV